MHCPPIWTLAMFTIFAATATFGSAQNQAAKGDAEPFGQTAAISNLLPHKSWNPASVRQRVILVHGFGSNANSLSPLANQLASDGLAVASFQYESHRGVLTAAKRLGVTLDDVAKAYPNDKIAIVTHSMGGLVARWLIEQSDSPPTNVNRLLMVAPPNAGSALALLSAASLVQRGGASESLSPNQQQQIVQLDTQFSTMLGVGGGDLRPDSEVLQKLAQPSIPSNIQYSVLAGNDGPMPAQTAGMGLALKLAAAVAMPKNRDQTAQAPVNDAKQGPNTEKMMTVAGNWLEFAGQPEWVSGQGDGVVSVQSTRLVGVTDHQVLPFRHNTLTGSIHTDGGRQLVDAIKKRLQP